MSLVLPTRQDLARYSFDVALDNATFTFDFEWNDRDSGWYMAITDANGNELLAGRRCVIGMGLIGIYRDTRLPAGEIVAVDTSSQDVEAGFADLGDRVKLLYITKAELQAA